MGRLPIVSGDGFVSAIKQIGYVWERTEGSHMILVHPTRHRLSVPRHKELGRGLLRRLLRDADLAPEEFLGLLST